MECPQCGEVLVPCTSELSDHTIVDADGCTTCGYVTDPIEIHG